MNLPLSPADRSAIDALVASLETSWNDGDAVGFAAPFAPDADFVNIYAEHHRGREAITAGHAAIFRTIYAGSRVRLTVEAARLLNPDLALVHVQSVLDAPSGPVAGRHHALFSMVLIRETMEWQVSAFHNTLQPRAPAGT